MDIKFAKYINAVTEDILKNIHIVLNNDLELSVPVTEGNSDYNEIMRQVDAGKLTIEEADSE